MANWLCHFVAVGHNFFLRSMVGHWVRKARDFQMALSKSLPKIKKLLGSSTGKSTLQKT